VKATIGILVSEETLKKESHKNASHDGNRRSTQQLAVAGGEFRRARNAQRFRNVIDCSGVVRTEVFGVGAGVAGGADAVVAVPRDDGGNVRVAVIARECEFRFVVYSSRARADRHGVAGFRAHVDSALRVAGLQASESLLGSRCVDTQNRFGDVGVQLQIGSFRDAFGALRCIREPSANGKEGEKSGEASKEHDRVDIVLLRGGV